MPELLCKTCKKPREIGRRTCASCFKQERDARAKARYLLKGRFWYYPICKLCKEPFKATKKTSLACAPCKLAIKQDNTTYVYSKRASGRLVWQHRVIAEEKLGRTLKPHEAVHHLDGNGQNNELANLMVLTFKSHSRLHSFLKNQRILFMAEEHKESWEKTMADQSLNWLKSAQIKFILLSDLA